MSRKPSPEDGAEPSISRMLHRAVQTAAELHAGIAGPGALTPRQHAILEAVAAEDGATQSQLVAATGVDRSNRGGGSCRQVRWEEKEEIEEVRSLDLVPITGNRSSDRNRS